ncbi:MAG: DUF3575 domain-containing protein [Rikenellaceae bacterium]
MADKFKNISLTVVRFVLLTLLFFPQYAYGQSEKKQLSVDIFFSRSGSDIDGELNREALYKLKSHITQFNQDSLLLLDSVVVASYTSPEGGITSNKTLSENRANSVKEFLLNDCKLSPEILKISLRGTDWDALHLLVQNSSIKNKEQLADIIENVPVETWGKETPDARWSSLLDSRNRQLMILNRGIPYLEMDSTLFPLLRKANITFYYTQNEPTVVVPDEPVAEPAIQEPEPQIEEVEEVEVESVEEQEIITKPLFALKTNLLYDLLLTPNIELEVPIGDKWSIGGEWICPWWVTNDNGYALQILSGQLEGRYWFGDRSDRLQLTGWFAGLYAGGGIYDLQWKNNGYQGEFYIAAGLSGGYAHTINKSGSLRMEYSLGVGYLNTDYRYYEGEQDNKFLVWQRDGNYQWLGPTKLEVSLVWLINYNKKR